ncbi:preprotein translocase subunit TatB [Oscillatoriales cyanobacterium USR001]|nr:preprotein translocase subunit TatB [Oscillatoriales cyanobacterium USR001]
MSETTIPMPNFQMDLRGTPCPINFVRTKLRLERMSPGEVLEVWLDPGEPIEQVPDSLRMEGYEILESEFVASGDRGYFALRVLFPWEKNPPEAETVKGGMKDEG